MLVVTPLSLWACDWSILLMETLLLEYSRAAIKLSSVNLSTVTKAVGITALMYIFQTLIVDIKNCLGYPQCSQLYVLCEKWDLSF